MPKILVIEDEKNIVIPLKLYLQKQGFEVLVATNGVDGVSLAQEEKPDVILLDIILPKMNGYLVCEALKENEETKHIPIIFITAKSNETEIEKALAMGGDDYLIKPFTHTKLYEVIKKYLKEENSHE
ncbi:response regulator transcription factor [Natranaerobius thermophilus]|uniref:Stage 0 sporulation protein A homolog n=1 Tax=Natranaerobius thermophilus (strain ATCC BAA-1301 / DSM 18059 / JW/NM-WN-LF) TaxID=457570 RepID=B2A4S8_NATTJ|nr:response regulator [Natranaerobius thermophilus]ACB83850.1 response regulator receiver protein [Natranaerobius thermophilus JW/NM-WN-LF]